MVPTVGGHPRGQRHRGEVAVAQLARLRDLALAFQPLRRRLDQLVVAAQQPAGDPRLPGSQIGVRALVERGDRRLVEGARDGPFGDDAEQPVGPPAVLADGQARAHGHGRRLARTDQAHRQARVEPLESHALDEDPEQRHRPDERLRGGGPLRVAATEDLQQRVHLDQVLLLGRALAQSLHRRLQPVDRTPGPFPELVADRPVQVAHHHVGGDLGLAPQQP